MMLQRCGGCGGKYVIGLLRCPVAGCGVMSAMYAPATVVPQITIGPTPGAWDGPTGSAAPPRREPGPRRRAPARGKPRAA